MPDLTKDAVLALAKDMADEAGCPWTSLVPVGREHMAEAATRGLGCQVYWLARAKFIQARVAQAEQAATEREREACAQLIEATEEAYRSSSAGNAKYVAPRHEGNQAGLAFAAAIRARNTEEARSDG